MTKKTAKRRLIEVLLEQGLARDEKHAQGLILSGEVLADEKPITQVGAEILESAQLRLRSEPQKYVSRGGFKLEAALQAAKLQVAGKICLDLGASTGGFTDCLLQAGAQKVYAVDVGYGQLAEKLRQDKRVVVLDRTHVRELNRQLIVENIELAVMDLSFIPAHNLLFFVEPLLAAQAHMVVLIKPQFELPAELIPAGGIVQDAELREQACALVLAAAEKLGWSALHVLPSPILGAKGNQEFLAVFARSPI